jgi:pimeloyl-ACP methyl ester carboxylesterase
MICALLGIHAILTEARTSDEFQKRLDEDRPYVSLPEAEFDRLGWDLPDGGKAVKAAADVAPGGAFSPEALETMPPAALGYRVRWHVVRYPYYGLDWDVTGLELVPEKRFANMPTVAIIHGGSANWYEFFVDPFNRPGLGQYLAQRVRVLLITIPGNYKPGGWSKPVLERVPPYLLDGKFSEQEVRLRTSVFTTKLVAEGIRQLLERTTTGPLVVVGHSTGGEIPFLLQTSSVGPRLGGMFLGWGSGGPARILEEDLPKTDTKPPPMKDPVWKLRVRSPEEYTNNYSYVGPLNPVKAPTRLEVAKGWFARESQRRPQFKQLLQDAEHRPARGSLAEVEPQIRAAAKGSKVDVDRAIADLFSTHRVKLKGFRKMLWLVARQDGGHWKADDPDASLEMVYATRFRRENPDAKARILVIDLPMSHYGHIECPRQLAGVFVESLKWLVAK